VENERIFSSVTDEDEAQVVTLPASVTPIVALPITGAPTDNPPAITVFDQ
jgi:hypothetical protein